MNKKAQLGHLFSENINLPELEKALLDAGVPNTKVDEIKKIIDESLKQTPNQEPKNQTIDTTKDGITNVLKPGKSLSKTSFRLYAKSVMKLA